MILIEKKSVRATILGFGTTSLNEFPQVILTLLRVNKSSWVKQQSDVVFCSTLPSPLVDGDALNDRFLI